MSECNFRLLNIKLQSFTVMWSQSAAGFQPELLLVCTCCSNQFRTALPHLSLWKHQPSPLAASSANTPRDPRGSRAGQQGLGNRRTVGIRDGGRCHTLGLAAEVSGCIRLQSSASFKQTCQFVLLCWCCRSALHHLTNSSVSERTDNHKSSTLLVLSRLKRFFLLRYNKLFCPHTEPSPFYNFCKICPAGCSSSILFVHWNNIIHQRHKEKPRSYVVGLLFPSHSTTSHSLPWQPSNRRGRPRGARKSFRKPKWEDQGAECDCWPRQSKAATHFSIAIKNDVRVNLQSGQVTAITGYTWSHILGQDQSTPRMLLLSTQVHYLINSHCFHLEQFVITKHQTCR